jgi:hypothetical protein
MPLTSHSGEETEAIYTASVNYTVTALEIREKQRRSAASTRQSNR